MSRPFRYTFILAVVALAVALAAAGGWRYARASAPISGPVIVISVDALRSDRLPAYGYAKGKTPAIDTLAADGVVFERAYAHAPQTLPAHAALFSGRLPFENGVRDNVGFVVKDGERLLPEMLRDRGFATGGVVSSFVLRKATGISQGFDFFDDDLPASGAEPAPGAVERDGSVSERVAEKWLDSAGTSRAFLFLHLNEPHAPYAPPERFAALDPYDGEIAYADEIVGRLVKYLKSHQLYDRSTIVLLADHGEGLGDHGEAEHGLFVYDEAIHVPLIVKQEGNAGAGRRVADLVQHIDIVPTLLDLVKASVPGQLRGRSLKPLLEGTGHPAPAAVYSESLYGRYHFGWSGLTALTDERYRYIDAPTEELYDLSLDAGERTNIATARPQARQSMRAALAAAAPKTAVPAPAELPAETLDRLQALGYLAARHDDVPGAGDDPLPDPKDRRAIVEPYRTAVRLAGSRQWGRAIAALQKILEDHPDMADVWAQLAALATKIDRHELAFDAYKRAIALESGDANLRLGAATALFRLRRYADARAQAEQSADVAAATPRERAAAHQLLMRVALAQRDADAARAEAERAEAADPKTPLSAFVEGRLLYDQGRYGDAIPHFEQAIAELRNPETRAAADLYYFAGHRRVRLDGSHDAEVAFQEELKLYPANARARAALAALFHATGRSELADQTLRDLLRIVPTPESYATAARLWTAFGNRQEAESVRAEARQAFGAPHRAAAKP